MKQQKSSRKRIATGQRVEEVLQARGEEFDLDGKLLTIPGERRKNRNKTTVDHQVPLTDFYIELLERIKTLSGDSDYLFPDRTGKAPRKSDALSQAVRRYLLARGKEY